MAVKQPTTAQCEISSYRKSWALERLNLDSCLSLDRISRRWPRAELRGRKLEEEERRCFKQKNNFLSDQRPGSSLGVEDCSLLLAQCA